MHDVNLSSGGRTNKKEKGRRKAKHTHTHTYSYNKSEAAVTSASYGENLKL